MNTKLKVGDKVFIKPKALLEVLKYQTNDDKQSNIPPLQDIMQSLKKPFKIKSITNIGYDTLFYSIEIFKGGEYLFSEDELVKVKEGL